MIALNSQSFPLLERTDDELLARSVRNFILPRVYPTSRLVHVEANGGVVTLTGRVGSFYYKQLWLSGAQRVAGVRRVVDEIDVIDNAQVGWDGTPG